MPHAFSNMNHTLIQMIKYTTWKKSQFVFNDVKIYFTFIFFCRIKSNMLWWNLVGLNPLPPNQHVSFGYEFFELAIFIGKKWKKSWKLKEKCKQQTNLPKIWKEKMLLLMNKFFKIIIIIPTLNTQTIPTSTKVFYI